MAGFGPSFNTFRTFYKGLFLASPWLGLIRFFQEEQPIPLPIPDGKPIPTEKSIDISYGDTGYSYDELFAAYMEGAKIIQLEEPYLSHPYQMTNLVRFIEMLVKTGTCKCFKLVTNNTSEDEAIRLRVDEDLRSIKETLEDNESTDMQFLYETDPNLHDRCIRTDTHWEIILGRGIHIYKDLNPDKENRNYFQMGTYDLALRPCLQCKITYRRTE